MTAKSFIPFENSYSMLPDKFFARVNPEVAPQPKLIIWNRELAEKLGIQGEGISDSELAAIFSGSIVAPGSEPIALAYAGHQFGRFVPQLGDGRAHLLGEVMARDGQRYDIQLKGSGSTPFSRRGDGKSSLGPVLREYIVSEAMYKLGVPTTRALAATTTGETVYRDTALPGGVFTRVAESHLRVGTFEYFSYRSDFESLRTLLNYTVQRHYPAHVDSKTKASDFLGEVVKRQAELIAHWMDVGFIHGVMNTDNTSVAGITIDYGPCAFMDHFNFEQVYSSIDHQGRYSYINQPSIIHWNLNVLADTLIPLAAHDTDEAIELLRAELEKFKDDFEEAWKRRFRDKLGIEGVQEGDLELINQWLSYLHDNRIDYTLAHRKLANCIPESTDPFFDESEELNQFLYLWRRRLGKNGGHQDEIKSRMNAVNPAFIPRNHQVERVIAAGIRGDFGPFHELNKVLDRPFEDQLDYVSFSLPPRPDQVVEATFCGT